MTRQDPNPVREKAEKDCSGRRRKEQNISSSGRRRKPHAELLAPAGSAESLRAAVAAGADAVYMGGRKFGARAYAENPDDENLAELIDYCHLRGVRLYLTVNTLMKEREMEGELFRFLDPLWERGLDAVLVQDLGVLSFIREHFPGMEIHVSTQMTVASEWGAAEAERMGASRLVLPRELSLDEIRRIHETSPLALETFVHGAMCYCVSGQCLMSSMIGGRSGNRGRCAQTCRLPFNGSHLLNMKDLCTIDILPEILDAGVTSLKIEGRMKSPRYTAGVVSVYRKYLDLALSGRPYRTDPGDRELLRDLFDRGGFTDGYYKRHNGACMIFPGEKPKHRETDPERLSAVEEKYVGKDRPVPVRGTCTVKTGEPVRFSVRSGNFSAVATGPVAVPAEKQPVSAEEIRERLMKTGGTAFAMEDLDLAADPGIFVPAGALNRLRREALAGLEETMLAAHRRSRDSAPAIPEQNADGPERRGADAQNADGPERRGADAQNAAGPERRGADAQHADSPGKLQTTGAAGARRLYVSFEDPAVLGGILRIPEVAGIYLPSDRLEPAEYRKTADLVRAAGKEVLLALPYTFRLETGRYFSRNITRLREAAFDGFLVRNIDEAGWLKKTGLPGQRVFDAGMYVWNRRAAGEMEELGCDVRTFPFELKPQEWESLGWENSELVIAGRIPLMVSAQCTAKTSGRCAHAFAGHPGFKTLTDRRRAEFREDSRCRFCYTVIYNSVPLWLADRIPAGCARLRVALTDESPVAAEQLVRRIASGQTRPPESFTRGHFTRGVE